MQKQRETGRERLCVYECGRETPSVQKFHAGLLSSPWQVARRCGEAQLQTAACTQPAGGLISSRTPVCLEGRRQTVKLWGTLLRAEAGGEMLGQLFWGPESNTCSPALSVVRRSSQEERWGSMCDQDPYSWGAVGP